MQSSDSQKIVERFFEVIYDLKARRVIRGKQTFTRAYGIDRWNFNKVEADKSRDIFQISWLAYLVNDFGVSSEWLMTGRGDMYISVPQPAKKR
jgi:hypothetical protein